LWIILAINERFLPVARAPAEQRLLSSPSANVLTDALDRNAFAGIQLGCRLVKVRDGGSAIASTGGARAPRTLAAEPLFWRGSRNKFLEARIFAQRIKHRIQPE
jgi:hypothetical protein